MYVCQVWIKKTITKKRGFREPYVPLVKNKEEELDLPIPVPSKQHPASRAFCLLDFSALKKDSASIVRVRSLLSMRCVLLGYSFARRPNSCAFGTAAKL